MAARLISKSGELTLTLLAFTHTGFTRPLVTLMLLHPKSLLNLPRANLAGLSDNLHIDIEIRSRSALDSSAGPESCVKSGVPHCVNCFGPRPADGFPLEALPTVSLLKPSLRLETRAQPTSAAGQVDAAALAARVPSLTDATRQHLTP